MAYKLLKIYEHIMQDSRLKTFQEKCLVCYVWSWQSENKACFVRDEFLSSLLDLNPGDLRILLESLQKRRILRINYDGARRLQVVTPGITIEEELQELTDIFSEL